MTYPAVSAGARDAVVDVGLAMISGEALRAGALERIDQVVAYSAVQAGLVGALVYVFFAHQAGET